MWKVRSITAQDFMSFEKVTYDFKEHCYVVRAENFDNEGQQSNGGGKTSFVDIIAVAILGYSLTGRNVKDCVRWKEGVSNFIVECKLENEVHKLTCVIQRTVHSNTRGQELVVLVNDAVPVTLPTKRGVTNGVDVKLGNKYILDSILGITENDLLSYFLISKSHYQPFLNINTDAKLDVITRFSHAEVVDNAIEQLGVDVKKTQTEIADLQRQVSECDGYLKALHDSLNRPGAEEEYEIVKQEQISALTQQQDNIVATIDEKEKQLGLMKEQYDDLIDKHIELNPQDKIDLQIRLKALDTREAVLLRNEAMIQLGEIENYLAGLITCPKCSHQFSLKSKAYTEKDLRDRESCVDDLNTLIKSIEQQQGELKEEIQLIEEAEYANRKVAQEIQLWNNKAAGIKQDQERLLNEFDHIAEKLEIVKAATYADAQAAYIDAIQKKEAEKSTKELLLTSTTKRIDEINQWVTNFEDFKFFLGNKPIEAICTLVNQYLALNGSDLNLFIEGFKKLRSGEIRQALQPVIYRNWTNPQSFQQFSEGEKVRLNLAVDLAFQQLINESSTFGGLDLYINDELINPLDSAGVANAAKAFDQLGKTIILVTHSGADMVYDNTIIIQKKDGRSEILTTPA